MRALAACLTVFLGLGAMTALASTMAGCSDTSDAGSGGASGAGTSAGASSGGASGGSGGMCSFGAAKCTSCLGTKCADEAAACQGDADCKAALQKLTPCACGGTDVDTCAGTFVTDGGDVALQFAQCYTLNCEADCM